MAQKKGGGSTRNGRDSQPKMLGVKVFGGQTVTAGQPVTLAPNSTSATFSVSRVTSGQPTTVRFTVTDACGAWQTFVGGGATAF